MLRSRSARSASLVVPILTSTAYAANFTQCHAKLTNLLTRNGTIALDPNGTIVTTEFSDPIYHGLIHGFNTEAADRPLTVTYQGCIDACGDTPEFNDVVNAFSILTTWVLPVIGLLTTLPYESLAEKKRKNIEAFGNWIGSPAAALTTTIWNISMIEKCRVLAELSQDPSMHPLLRDSLYVLSCINQYQYPRDKGHLDFYERRDVALLRGVLAPYVMATDPDFPPALREKVYNLTLHLAFQLRLYRRKGVYPLWFSLIWFLLAFIFSIVIAFAQLGDNTTAHSLALGLLLSWMPILVLATIVDRNPVASTRCGILIERWLYNIDALFAMERIAARNASISPAAGPGASPLANLAPPSPNPTALSASSSGRPSPSTPPFDDDTSAIDGGQDSENIPLISLPPRIQRKPLPATAVHTLNQPGPSTYRYTSTATTGPPNNPSLNLQPNSYGSAHRRNPSTPTSNISAQPQNTPSPPAPPIPLPTQWNQSSNMTPFNIGDYVGQGRRMRYCAVTDTVLTLLTHPSTAHLPLPNESHATLFRRGLPHRPPAWIATWFTSQFLVSLAFSMAFIVSFKTPTIGLGCRSLSYTIWYLLSLIPWGVLGIYQEPPHWTRILLWVPNALSSLTLFSIMSLQVTGGLNSCRCKASMFGIEMLGVGGYMDFENAQFYHRAFGVQWNWGVATGFGIASCSAAILWFARRWSTGSGLWRVREGVNNGLVEGVSLEWLT